MGRFENGLKIGSVSFLVASWCPGLASTKYAHGYQKTQRRTGIVTIDGWHRRRPFPNDTVTEKCVSSVAPGTQEIRVSCPGLRWDSSYWSTVKFTNLLCQIVSNLLLSWSQVSWNKYEKTVPTIFQCCKVTLTWHVFFPTDLSMGRKSIFEVQRGRRSLAPARGIAPQVTACPLKDVKTLRFWWYTKLMWCIFNLLENGEKKTQINFDQQEGNMNPGRHFWDCLGHFRTPVLTHRNGIGWDQWLWPTYGWKLQL